MLSPAMNATRQAAQQQQGLAGLPQVSLPPQPQQQQLPAQLAQIQQQLPQAMLQQQQLVDVAPPVAVDGQLQQQLPAVHQQIAH